eukprot:COSAG01_NODE_4447_length_5012_cov_7.832078_5_plen_103_part_00
MHVCAPADGFDALISASRLLALGEEGLQPASQRAEQEASTARQEQVPAASSIVNPEAGRQAGRAMLLIGRMCGALAQSYCVPLGLVQCGRPSATQQQQSRTV